MADAPALTARQVANLAYLDNDLRNALRAIAKDVQSFADGITERAEDPFGLDIQDLGTDRMKVVESMLSRYRMMLGNVDFSRAIRAARACDVYSRTPESIG